MLPLGFAAIAWLTGRFAPEAAGSGIPQVIAAAEQRWRGRWGGNRVTLKTAVWKVVLSAALLLCGGSIGREGPTVQVVAGIMRTVTRGLKGGPGRHPEAGRERLRPRLHLFRALVEHHPGLLGLLLHPGGLIHNSTEPLHDPRTGKELC